MEYLRKTVNSDTLSSIFDLPTSLKNRNVEVIILPLDNERNNKPQANAAKGRLKKYANPTLASKEKDAWARSVEKKYANS